jgi:serine phosphatase RsbU (regulator of sigma subunit)
MKIGLKLTLLFVAISLLATSIIGYVAYKEGKESLERESFNRLTAVREMKAGQIEDYFKLIENQIISYSKNQTVVLAMQEFKDGFNRLPVEYAMSHSEHTIEFNQMRKYYKDEFIAHLDSNSDKTHKVDDFFIKNESGTLLQSIYIANNPNPPGEKHNLTYLEDSLNYIQSHNSYHPLFKEFLEKFGYYDIFLIDNKTGNIVYSVFKEVDFGSSLKNGAFANTNFSRVFEAAVGSNDDNFVSLVDYEPYEASHNAPAAFMSSPIFDKGECIGVLVFQMPIQKIDDIMTNREQWKDVGLGETGETYLVSEDHTLRNQSRFLIEDRKEYFKMIREIGMDEKNISQIEKFNSTVGLQKVETEGTNAALKGEIDTRIFKDYRGVEVLSSFKPLEIRGLNWVIMSEIDKSEAFMAADNLRNKIWYYLPITLIIIVVISYFVSRMITKPIKSLTKTASELSRGNFDVKVNVEQKDEIGMLALSFKSMQGSIHTLIDDLKESNRTLEDKVEARTKELQLQKNVIEEKNKEIVDSIQYAQRLQNAILPTSQFIQDNLNDSFIFFKPKDIVSGDFYWMERVGDQVLVAAVDCTGHGVPGAMVSIVGANGLHRCITEFGLTKPSDILDKLRELVIQTFSRSGEDVKDGMDISLLSINTDTFMVAYAGANNPLWLARTGAEEIEVIKGDKQPIGKYDYAKPFTHQEGQLKKGDCLYLFTDGFADQFGGEKGKKLKYKPFQQLLLSNVHLPMHEQKHILGEAFLNWMADFEQVDDVCVIGIKL